MSFKSYGLKIVKDAKLLRQTGHSLGQISSKLNISKSTASLWTSQVKISEVGLQKITKRQNNARQKAFQTIAKNRNLIQEIISKKASSAVQTIKIDPSLCKLLASIFIWTEGQKGNFEILSFTNSDPLMVSTFLKLLRNSFLLNESKFRALVHLHEYHNEDDILAYWSKLTKIPLDQFTKSYLKPHTGVRKHLDYKGCIRITYYDFKVARELASIYNMFAFKLRGIG